MDANEYFCRLLQIEPLYTTEVQVFRPFWDFEYRFRTLQQHWELNCDYISEHRALLEEVDGEKFCSESEIEDEFGITSESAEFQHMLDGAVEPFEFMREYLRASTISFSLALVENLLLSLSSVLSEETGIEPKFADSKLPYIEKYILWMNRSCGLSIMRSKRLNREINAMREIRNRFVHEIDRDLSDQTKTDIARMTENSLSTDDPVTNEVVEVALSSVAELAKIIEEAYIEFREGKLDGAV